MGAADAKAKPSGSESTETHSTASYSKMPSLPKRKMKAAPVPPDPELDKLRATLPPEVKKLADDLLKLIEESGIGKALLVVLCMRGKEKNKLLSSLYNMTNFMMTAYIHILPEPDSRGLSVETYMQGHVKHMPCNVMWNTLYSMFFHVVTDEF
jgi:hypothetical protein